MSLARHGGLGPNDLGWQKLYDKHSNGRRGLILNQHRTAHLIVCLSLLLLADGYADEKTRRVTVPIEDTTMPGSPLKISGHVSFDETVVANEVTSHRSEDVRARNMSGKPILLIVASFQEAGPKSSGEDVEIVVDSFFQEKAMLPGETVPLWHRPFGEHYISEPFRLDPNQERPGKAQFYLRFIQFSDGSTFGDPTAARKWLDRRDATLVSLKKLRQTYNELGEPSFFQALDKDLNADGQISLGDQIRKIQQTRGSQAAVAFIDRTLLLASLHRASLIEQPEAGPSSSVDPTR
jgi:hypothetical protein